MSNIEIKANEAGKLEARGFLLEEEGQWILYPEPALNSCCRNGNLKMGLNLSGNIPTGCKGKCITVQGVMQNNTLDITSTTSSLSCLWVIAFLSILIFLFKLRHLPKAVYKNTRGVFFSIKNTHLW